MTTIRKQLLISLAVLGLAGTTLGARAADPATGQPGQWEARAASHRQQLHDALHLTPAQETAWNNYLAATPRHDAGQRPQRGEWQAMSAPERLERQIAMARRHADAMQARLAALQPFYASLTPEQKKVFDAQSGHHGRHHGMRHGGV